MGVCKLLRDLVQPVARGFSRFFLHACFPSPNQTSLLIGRYRAGCAPQMKAMCTYFTNSMSLP